MDKTKTGSKPAPGAAIPSVEHYRKMIQQDLKTARVLCHFVSKYPAVRDVILVELQDRVPGQTHETLEREAEKAFTFLTYALETSVLLDSVADVTQGLADNFKQAQANAATMANSGAHARG